ncbi:MAG: HAMP domain-containing histidine kinase [Saprospirales bacterium]|nr:HAMP domain-containing histidine kinase [Saprospirales bacterium]
MPIGWRGWNLRGFFWRNPRFDSRIPPGSYILHINGRGENGQWASEELRIPIWVAKPFYLRPAFWLGAGLVLILIAFLYYQFHLWQLKVRKNWLEQEVNRRTQDLQESQRLVNQQYRELEKLNRTKDHLFLILAHELKNPVLSFRNISQKINYLLSRKQMDRLQQLGATLDRNAIDAHNLLDNLLHWGKTQQGTFTMHPRIIYVHEAFAQVMEHYQPRVEEKKIQLTTCLDNEEVSIWADPTAFQILLRNLVDNAVKFTPSSGTICLCANEVKEGGTLVEVTDTGLGMKPEVQQLLFQPSDKPSVGTAGERGSGLGLLLVRELMNLHHGELRIQSEYGKGSTFGLWFPVPMKTIKK